MNGVPSSRVPLTPSICGLMAQHLGYAVESFERWGIRIVDVNRLREAQRLLQEVCDDGAFPSDPSRLGRVAHALQDAHDFRYITSCMPRERLEPIARDLQLAVGGDLRRDATNRVAYQYQSQFLVGALIAFAGSEPIIQKNQARRTPDYWILNGTSYYAVEVKRPASEAGASKLLKSASKQLSIRPCHVGAAVFDLSDCIDMPLFEAGRSEEPARILNDLVAQHSVKLEDQIFDEESRRFLPGFERIGVLVSFARAFWWNPNDMSRANLIGAARFVAFHPKGLRTLTYHRTEWLREVFYRGLVACGYDVTRGVAK